MSGAFPPLLNITLWRDQRKFILLMIFMATEAIKKLHESIRIQSCGIIKKNYRDLL